MMRIVSFVAIVVLVVAWSPGVALAKIVTGSEETVATVTAVTATSAPATTTTKPVMSDLSRTTGDIAVVVTGSQVGSRARHSPSTTLFEVLESQFSSGNANIQTWILSLLTGLLVGGSCLAFVVTVFSPLWRRRKGRRVFGPTRGKGQLRELRPQ